MEVFTVFCVTGDGTGCTIYDLVGIARTAHGASVIVRDQFDEADAERDLVHASMSADNNFTFFGDRAKTRQSCRWGDFGGYVVEKPYSVSLAVFRLWRH